MNLKEKEIIKDLFLRLENSNDKESAKKIDKEANKFIKKNISKNSNSAYFLVQSILVQEVVIKKMKDQIDILEKELSDCKIDKKNSKKGFFSGFLDKYINSSSVKKENIGSEKNISVQNKDSDNNIDIKNNFRRPPLSSSLNGNIPFSSSYNNDKNFQSNSTINGGNGFLGNALQTAVGVAGGVVAGNAISSLFHKDKFEDEILVRNFRNSEKLNDDSYEENVNSDFNKDLDSSSFKNNSYEDSENNINNNSDLKNDFEDVKNLKNKNFLEEENEFLNSKNSTSEDEGNKTNLNNSNSSFKYSNNINEGTNFSDNNNDIPNENSINNNQFVDTKNTLNNNDVSSMENFSSLNQENSYTSEEISPENFSNENFDEDYLNEDLSDDSYDLDDDEINNF